LHFLAAWLLVVPGAIYLWLGLARGHFRAHLLPTREEITPRRLGRELLEHLRLRVRSPTGGPQYGALQKCAYSFVVFAAVPLMVVTGLAMSPAVTAAVPLLLDIFGGYQSARTLHFFAFAALVLFVLLHVLMVAVSGFRRQIRAMTVGE
ncbi:MAG: cytochrome b/b6 domain-containing protein, partial [Thermoanaerobaculia bacterium]|nr:cytochrome b/b6 domain-containing protein [Thermoanaerobaculia bacterium]